MFKVLTLYQGNAFNSLHKIIPLFYAQN
jgi:hypothetical protein